jgi:hypothetical protein
MAISFLKNLEEDIKKIIFYKRWRQGVSKIRKENQDIEIKFFFFDFYPHQILTLLRKFGNG